MASKDPRIDAYIAKSADFAKPILTHLRKLVHAGCPDVEEAIKWGAPHFMFHGMMSGMAAFRSHCVFGFWNRAMKLPNNAEAMGQFGRITSLADLPPDRVVIGYVREAARLNAAGVKGARTPRRPKKAIPIPADLRSALKKSPRARKSFEGFSPSHKREYLEWITQAKGEETRRKRLDTAIGWMAEGKPRHWKYMKREPNSPERRSSRPGRRLGD
jgi:uncharacterized protein YdeI (YjbR/CyaY-like superfamily)